MTSIAVKITDDLIQVASDTQLTGGDTIHGDVIKIVRLGNTIIGGCGDFQEVVKWMKWMVQGECATELQSAESFSGFIVSSDGVMKCVDNRFIEYQVTNKHGIFAFGTGDRIALGAMRAGATAEEAVQIACELDIYSGGGVDVLEMKRGERKCYCSSICSRVEANNKNEGKGCDWIYFNR